MLEMKAVRAHERGGPEQLIYEVAPRPTPGSDEALVRVCAASITRDELTWVETWADAPGPEGRDRTPTIPSHEMSGVVAGLGADVLDLAVGDDVFGLLPFNRDGAAAEFVTVRANLLAGKPDTISHDEAASVPLAALTAWQALIDHADLRAGQHVLIHGAAGGVGVFAVQLGAHLQARVTATARLSDALFLHALGAAEVIPYQHEDFASRVGEFDVVLDMVGGKTQNRSWQVLRPGGVLLSVVAPPDKERARAAGTHGVFFIVKPDRRQLESIARLVDMGRLSPVVDRVMSLEDSRAAYELLEREHHRGKVVIHVAD